jgi:hypothetical protein
MAKSEASEQAWETYEKLIREQKKALMEVLLRMENLETAFHLMRQGKMGDASKKKNPSERLDSPDNASGEKSIL